MKIGIIIHFYYLKNLYNKIKSGMTFPNHHLWGYDYLLSKGYIVEEEIHENVKNSFLSKFFSSNMRQQKRMAKHTIDILYSPFFFDCYYLALLRSLGLYKKPILAIAQDTWRQKYAKSNKTKLLWKYYRFLAKYGIDRLLFISPNVLSPIKSDFDPKKTFSLQHWGVDLNYFDEYIKKNRPKPNYYSYAFATGNSNRDFAILYAAALKDNKNQIIIQTNRMTNIPKAKIPQNIILDNSVTKQSDLLSGYYNAFCVLIPLKEDTGSMTGITVVFEAMAMGKAVISTKSQYYPFDIEKEKCGIYIDYSDVEGWQKAITYLRENPEIAQKMGENGRKIVETRYNYKLFCMELEQHIKQLYTEKMKLK